MELVFLDFYNRCKINEKIVVTIGQFDGLHKAHQILIDRTLAIAKEKKLKSAIFTFDPHPNSIINNDNLTTYITPLHKKIEILKDKEIDYLVVIKFTKNIMEMGPMEFIDDFLIGNNVIEAVIGYDFSFGKNGMGKANDINILSHGNIKTTIIEEQKYLNQKIGTTLIKKLLNEGKVDEVKELLGYYYTITGVVVKGKQIGRTINVPTANLSVNEDFAMIKPGVYVVLVKIDNIKKIGIANLGNNPSFNYSKKMVFETHIIDFNQDIYGRKLEIELIKYIREEIKFSSKDEFIVQIDNDIDFAKKLINSIKC